MKIRHEMILYHGSYTAVEKIDLDKCREGKDFGKGFYLTSDFSQSRNFIKASIKKAQNYGIIPGTRNYGFVSFYKFHWPENGLKIHEFDTADKNWLWFVSINRRRNLAQILYPVIDHSLFQSDIIIGKIANDTTNPVITTYLNGLYGDILSDRAISIAIEQLIPDNLKDQYCFQTEESISCLEFLEARKYVI